MDADPNLLVVVTGPTAVGKTALAIKLASNFGTEIISADSRQFYKELKIGTAVPEPFQLQTIKHHFVQNLSIESTFNVADFEQQALKVIEDLHTRHRYVVVAGGSGLYIDALCNGIDDFPDADPELRQSLNEQYKLFGIDYLRGQLKLLDPDYYKEVDLANHKRLLRALEVCIGAGKPYSSMRKNAKRHRSFKIIKIGLNLPRQLLFERIALRVNQMMADGLESEARSLYHLRHLNALNTVGYKELFSYFDGEITLDRAIEDIKTNTRRYAKRQLTWLARDFSINWYSPDQLDDILNFVTAASV
jgi:tRNA dimethylallyltransferase